MSARATLAAAILLASTAAHAYPNGSQFDSDPLTGDGAGGLAFDGAPRFAGHTCDVCHTNPAGRIELRVESDHPELFTDGWVGGMQYHLRVSILDEHAGLAFAGFGDNCGPGNEPYQPCDNNGFALEIDTAAGTPTGTWSTVTAGACDRGAAPGADAYVLADGTAVTHSGSNPPLTGWDICWTAPASGAGLLTAYLAAVDGNGGDGTAAFPADTIGDDVAVGQLVLLEQGGGPPPASTGGCSTGTPGNATLLAVAALALLAYRRRRMRTVRLGAIAVAAAMLASGCAHHVRASQRETLARKNMQFGPDPAEDELDLHMQEAREGSSGGYGSSGGGCGCN